MILQLANDIGAVEQCRLAARTYLAPFELSDRVLNRIEVILEELVSNVVRHGVGVEHLSVAVEHDHGGDVCLVIEDDGAAFDPLRVNEPAPFTQLDEAVLGGLGIPLVRRLSRSVSYDRVGTATTGRNRFTAIVAAA